MVHKFVKEEAKNWDKWLEPLLFAVWEVPQASTGFSPFKLLYGRQPRGVLDVIRESNSHIEIQYVMDLRAKLHTLGRLSMENLLQAQDRQSRLYNRGTRERQFTPGDKVLVLLPTSSSKLLTKWQFAAVCRSLPQFADVFSPLPGRTDLIQHHIETLPGEVARSRPYRLPEHKKKWFRRN